MSDIDEDNIDVRRFRISLIFPTFFLIILWLIKVVEISEELDLSFLGVFPRRASGLIGIITSPLVHANVDHLINNSVPLFFLSVAVFFFYYKVAFKVFFYGYFFTGLAVWLFARPSHHIGASGLIYVFGSFLFFGGIIRQNINLLAISLLVTFLYGSMVWGIFPYKPDMSWESHLMGMMVGLGLAILYRNEGPTIKKHVWEEEEEEAPPDLPNGEEKEAPPNLPQGEEKEDPSGASTLEPKKNNHGSSMEALRIVKSPTWGVRGLRPPFGDLPAVRQGFRELFPTEPSPPFPRSPLP